MNNQTYEITIDTKKSHCHSNIEFSQHNLNISELIFNITEDEKEFPLKDTDKIIVYFRKPDKTVVFQDKEVVLLDKAKGKIKVLLTTQTLAKSGNVNGEISIERVENGTKKRVSTYGFSFKVRSSIASNDSIESTNEFQVFDKIIKVGEKFEGVDIEGIIAAGELAKGALPKTGGTMMGNFGVQIPNAGSNGISFKSTSGLDIHNWIGTSTGAVAWQDKLANTDVFNYSSVSKTLTMMNGVAFNVAGATNLLKKTGDTMTGSLTFDSPFTVRGSGASWDMRPYTSGQYSKGMRHTINTTNNFYAMAPIDEAGAANWSNQAALYGNTGVWDVKDINVRGGSASNVVTKLKDGRANISITADGELISGNGVIADRRGNTVTLRAGVRRKVGIPHTNAIFTLPVDMRPLLTVQQNTISTDGTPCLITIQTNGEFSIQNVGSNNAQGKDYYVTISYVVD
ncbi:BppU family phage baseplate upper protein [Bacillus anthracis]|uniref:BppU family phage baseplate upper protein n=1 Tax=Bacillus anthracis TaxID=1392 RepID=UPI002DB7F420|nr:BppU family phage baseplate upper protein [Bacillus anthracis]MEB9454444.1 BppU family phage baseplate upper protein [Bacillus anthracis]